MSSSSSTSTPSSSSSPSYTGCDHYQRKCQLLAPCCSTYYPCRFCHDEERDENEKDVRKAHKLDRKRVQTVKCMNCLYELSPPAQTCPRCSTVLGQYFCSVCNLYDDNGTTKQIFHCDGCGICRVGGRENYFHCDKCASCLAIALRNNHKCLGNESGLHQNCPVCLEYMHTSRRPSQLLPCGHAMHVECYTSYAKTNYKCPFCNASLGNMRAVWRNMDRERRLTPMPLAYRNTWVRILCNDCHTESDTKFHVVGLKCRNTVVKCGSYNTRKLGAPKDNHAEDEESVGEEEEGEQPDADGDDDDDHDDNDNDDNDNEGEDDTLNLQPFLPSIEHLRTFLRNFIPSSSQILPETQPASSSVSVTSSSGSASTTTTVPSPDDENHRQLGQALYERLSTLVPVVEPVNSTTGNSSSVVRTAATSSSSTRSTTTTTTTTTTTARVDDDEDMSRTDVQHGLPPSSSAAIPFIVSTDTIQELQSIVAFAQMIGYVGGEDILDIYEEDEEEEENEEEENGHNEEDEELDGDDGDNGDEPNH